MKNSLQKSILIATLFAICGWSNVANAQWQKATGTNSQITCLAANGNNIFAGPFLSTDNGNSWSVINELTAAGNLEAVAVNGSTVVIGTSSSNVMLSTDNGKSYTKLTIKGLSTSAQIYSVAIVGNTIIAGTYGGYGAFFSANNGSSWTACAGFGYQSIQAFITIGNKIFAGTYSGGVYVSTDTAKNWTNINNSLSRINTFALSGSKLFAGTENDGVYLSADTGKTWTKVSNGLTDVVVRSLAISGNKIFAGTYTGGVFLSTNNGSNWGAVNTGLVYTHVLSLATNGTNLFAGTDDGIFKRPVSEIVGIEENSNNAHFTMYPNPSNGKFTVNMENVRGKMGDVKLAVYNVLGERVYSATHLQITKLSNYQIDLSALPAGIYFLQVNTGEEIVNRKLVLEK